MVKSYHPKKFNFLIVFYFNVFFNIYLLIKNDIGIVLAVKIPPVGKFPSGCPTGLGDKINFTGISQCVISVFYVRKSFLSRYIVLFIQMYFDMLVLFPDKCKIYLVPRSHAPLLENIPYGSSPRGALLNLALIFEVWFTSS